MQNMAQVILRMLPQSEVDKLNRSCGAEVERRMMDAKQLFEDNDQRPQYLAGAIKQGAQNLLYAVKFAQVIGEIDKMKNGDMAAQERFSRKRSKQIARDLEIELVD